MPNYENQSQPIYELIYHHPLPHLHFLTLLLLNELVKERPNNLGALLREPLLPALIIHKRDSKPRLVSLSPLKVIHQTPRHVRTHIHAILLHRLRQRRDVAAEVLSAELVIEDALERQVILALERRPVLSDVDLGVSVALAEPHEEVAESGRVGAQPERLGLGADVIAILGLEERLEVAEEVVVGGGGGLVLDVVGGVVVHAVEVVGALDERDFLGGEGGEAVAELLLHRLRVGAEVDGVGEPGDGELDLAVAGLDILWVLRIPGVDGVT